MNKDKVIKKLNTLKKKFEDMTLDEYDEKYAEMMTELKNMGYNNLLVNNNYKIILDEEKLDEFIEWLPELEANEQYYITLFFRKKYFDLIKRNKGQLKRVTASKKFIKRKIKQMEVELGNYTLDDTPLPEGGLALYITPNPRDLEKATKASLIKFVNIITKPYDGYNPQSLVMTEIQRSCSRKIYMDFDFDIDYLKFDETITQIKESINIDACTIVVTRGGFHLLIETKKILPEYVKSWYKNLSSIEGCDVRGDNLLPVVGCRQGDFTPHFLKK